MEPRNSWEITYVIQNFHPKQVDLGLEGEIDWITLLGVGRVKELTKWANRFYGFKWFKDHYSL